ncbi:hypothetical protein B0H14DRAFT_2626181 [Mycena olivaceomarginata]|nr:hypothetical protein B0H14DRAFT_2626181 [Mycena olivaceomarginata]
MDSSTTTSDSDSSTSEDWSDLLGSDWRGSESAPSHADDEMPELLPLGYPDSDDEDDADETDSTTSSEADSRGDEGLEARTAFRWIWTMAYLVGIALCAGYGKAWRRCMPSGTAFMPHILTEVKATRPDSSGGDTVTDEEYEGNGRQGRGGQKGDAIWMIVSSNTARSPYDAPKRRQMEGGEKRTLTGSLHRTRSSGAMCPIPEPRIKWQWRAIGLHACVSFTTLRGIHLGGRNMGSPMTDKVRALSRCAGSVDQRRCVALASPSSRTEDDGMPVSNDVESSAARLKARFGVWRVQRKIGQLERETASMKGNHRE